MYLFIFEQYNSFGETLKVNVLAENEIIAKDLIKSYINDNTETELDSAKSEEKYMECFFKDALEKTLKYIDSLSEHQGKTTTDIERETNERMSEVITYLREKPISLNDYNKNSKAIIEEFGNLARENTYMWHFMNKRYKLNKKSLNKSKIIDVNYIYTGK